MKNEVRPIDANAMERKIREYMRSLPASTARIMEYHKVLSMLGDEGQTPTLQLGCNIAATGEPLTLEQLREMANKPYWHVGLRSESADPHWKILDPFIARFPEDYGYGKRWLAYAYPPARIDREAWEKPCGMCGGKTILYQHTNTTKLFMNTFGEAATLVTECMACPPYADCCMKGISANSAFKINFCPECGRPLTEEAWAELEKRMGVRA